MYSYLSPPFLPLEENCGILSGEKLFHGIKSVLALSIILGVFLAVTIANRTFFPISNNKEELFLGGGFIIIIAVILRVWSVQTLGKFFRTTVMVQEKHQVISHGPYKYVRHPSYSAILLGVCGAGIATDNWFAIVTLLLVIFIGLQYRIRIEEEVLRTALGKAYEDYIKRTKMFIPFIY